MASPPASARKDWLSLAMIGGTLLAMVCCIGVPLLLPFFAGAAAAGLGAPLWAAGVVVLAGVIVMLVFRRPGARPSVELLYFEGCPNYVEYLPRLQSALKAAGLKALVTLRRVESEEDAISQRFLGSPTVRVDGRDVEPGAEARTGYGLQCRLYRTANGFAGAPPDEWVLNAVLGHNRGKHARQDRAAAAS